MLHTTFNELKLAGFCGQRPGSGEGYDKLATHLGSSNVYGENTPIPLAVVVESNGLKDALWCLHATAEDFEMVVHPFIRGYLADVLEHLTERVPFSMDVINLLNATTDLLRSPDAHVAAYAVRAADAADAHAVVAADAAAYAAAAARAVRAYYTAHVTHYADAAADSADAAARAVRSAYAAYAATYATDSAAYTDAATDAAAYAVAYATYADVADSTDAANFFDAFDAAFDAERKWQTERFLAALSNKLLYIA